ncbi:MAG: hypothetical protein WDO73_13905 [Ignavibacteriota bacterium]
MFHFIAALIYSLAPVTLFYFAFVLSRRIPVGVLAALLWSLFSPSAMIPAIRVDLGSVFGLRRFQTVVYYGEVPHNVAICLLPLALISVARYLERPSWRWFGMAALAVAGRDVGQCFRHRCGCRSPRLCWRWSTANDRGGKCLGSSRF